MNVNMDLWVLSITASSFLELCKEGKPWERPRALQVGVKELTSSPYIQTQTTHLHVEASLSVADLTSHPNGGRQSLPGK